MNNDKLSHIAQDIVDNSEAVETENFSSVLILLTVISIILTLIRVLQECDKSRISKLTPYAKCSFFRKNIQDVCKKRSLFTRITVKKLIKKELDNEEYKLYGVSLMQSILNKGSCLTDDEVQTLVEAANV
jgi:hypothetical protein